MRSTRILLCSPSRASTAPHLVEIALLLDRRTAYAVSAAAAFLTADSFRAGVVFYVAADFAFAALTAAHRFFVAAMILAIPSLLILRFAFGACAGAGTVFFTAAPVAFAALAALAFFRFATSTAFAAAESFRFAFGGGVGAGAGGSDSPFIFAHLAFCARAIFRRAAAENFLRFPGLASGVVVAVSEEPVSIARSSLICLSISIFCCSNPAIAAEMICGDNFCGMWFLSYP